MCVYIDGGMDRSMCVHACIQMDGRTLNFSFSCYKHLYRTGQTTAATVSAHYGAYKALAHDNRLLLAGRVLDKIEAFLLRLRSQVR